MADVLHGTPGNNQLNATANRTQVYGLSGNDTLASDGKSDVLLVGGSGSDSLIMSGGNGTLSGGAGADTFELTYSVDKKLSAVIEDLVPSEDKIVVNFDGNTPPQISTVTSGTDVILRDGDGNFNVTLNGVRDNDYLDNNISDEAWEVLRLTNVEREKENLPALTMSDGLTAGAQIRAQEISTLGDKMKEYGHTRPGGLSAFTVLQKKYLTVGENLEAGASSPEAVMGKWITSASHYTNIVNPDFLKLGVGYVENDSDQSNQRFYWTQMFAAALSSTEKVTIGTDELLTASVEVNTVTKVVTLTDGNDTYANPEYGATIEALGGDDSVSNAKPNVSISGGADNDTLQNGGDNVTISGGAGNDDIRLTSNATNNLIQYASGDGYDTVSGFNADDTLSITGNEYTPATVGNNVVIGVGTDSITLTGAAGLSTVNIVGTRSKLFIGTEDADSVSASVDDATIAGLGGNDTIRNNKGYASSTAILPDGYANVSISGGAGNDTLNNYGASATITGDDGSDTVSNNGLNVSIAGGAGNDSLSNYRAGTTITGGDGSDTVFNNAAYVTIDAGDDNDRIANYGGGVSLVGGTGDDSINNGSSATRGGNNVTINGGAGNDRINLTSTVQSSWSGYQEGGAQNNLIQYAAGDGSDTVYGFNTTATLKIDGDYFTQQSDNDFIVNVGAGSIRLADAATLTAIHINDAEYNPASSSSKFIPLTEGDDTYSNSLGGATIAALGGNDSITNYGVQVSISGGAGSDTLDNYGSNATITGGAGYDILSNSGASSTLDGDTGNDRIYNYGSDSNISINGGDGRDTISNYGSNVTISGGLGDDRIQFGDNAQNNLVLYMLGDGNDYITNFNATDTLQIGDGSDTYATVASGGNVIVSAGTGLITLEGATSLGSRLNIAGTEGSKTITLTDGNDTYRNVIDGATILALGGDDYIANETLGTNVLIDAGTGDDSIDNYGDSATLDGGAGKDTIWSFGSNVSIGGGTGSDTIFAERVYGMGYEEIVPENVIIDAGDGDDYVSNDIGIIIIDLGAGNDTIDNYSRNVTVNCGDGNDYVSQFGVNSSVIGGAGDDTFVGGDNSSNATIDGGAGNDQVSLLGSAENNFIRYTAGDGDDTIWGLNPNSTVNFLDIDADDYDSVVSGDDIILTVGDGSITLKDSREKPPHVIIGESGTEGGGSDSGGDGGGSSSGSGDGGRGGNDGGNVSGGTSSNEGMNSDVSGGRSAVGSRGRSSSTSSNTSGNNVRGTTSSSRGGGSRIAVPNSTVDLMSNWTTSTQQPTTQPTATAQRVYTGGNQVVGDYVSGEKIVFGDVYTGAFYDGAGNFFAGSTTGALVIQNAADKVVDLSDASGNSFVKAYMATTAGVIDGRGLTGFEIINGSSGSDAIFAGDGGSQLWGGLDTAADTMIGGGGTDIFIGGRTQGADVILNATAGDIVHLNDATLGDIMATAEQNGAIAVAFNTGNVVAVQSTEPLSAAFMLADGSAYRYNHANKSWQTA